VTRSTAPISRAFWGGAQCWRPRQGSELMDLTHRFTVPASIEDTWAAFNDLEAIAPCFPGATVESVDGDDFAGSVKVKLGPIALVYNGTGKFIERDNEAHRAVIEARGKDKRGNGTASATVRATLTADGDGTAVEVITDLSITGKPAQFGRGVIQDVSDKLLGTFVTCISEQFAAGLVDAEAADPEVAVEGGAPTVPVAVDPEPATQPPSEPIAAARPAPASAAASPSPSSADTGGLNLLSTIGPVLLKRYGPFVLAGIGLLLVILGLTKKARSRPSR
jgi:uncharacterized protein